MPRLFHASEDPNIQLFEPRPAPSPGSGLEGEAVWAVSESHLPNYLLPRDCPRVTFAAAAKTTEEDRRRFLTGDPHSRVIALEEGWLPRIRSCELYLYEFSPTTFECLDPGAGYYVSRVPVKPISRTLISDLLSELENRSAVVRFLPNLWELRDAVASSTLEFSIIRFRNAAERK